MITTKMIDGLAPHKRVVFKNEAKKVWAEFAVRSQEGMTEEMEEAYDLEIKVIFEAVQSL